MCGASLYFFTVILVRVPFDNNTTFAVSKKKKTSPPKLFIQKYLTPQELNCNYIRDIQ